MDFISFNDFKEVLKWILFLTAVLQHHIARQKNKILAVKIF